MNINDSEIQITLSENEQIEGFISENNLRKLSSNFLKFGVISIKNIIDNNLIEKLHSAAEENFNHIFSELKLRGITKDDNIKSREICSRETGRYDILHGIDKKPFTEKRLTDNPILNKVLKTLLGQKYNLLFQGLVWALPGAKMQSVHRDGPKLFEEINLPLPPHCINVFIPLINLDIECGPTEFFLGSHISDNKKNPCTMLANVGSIIIFDYKLFHRGLENKSNVNRPIFYLTFCRPWFDDKINFPSESIFDK